MKVASKKLTFPPSPLGRGSTVQRGADSKHCPPTSFPPLREGKSIVVPLRSPSKGQWSHCENQDGMSWPKQPWYFLKTVVWSSSGWSKGRWALTERPGATTEQQKACGQPRGPPSISRLLRAKCLKSVLRVIAASGEAPIRRDKSSQPACFWGPRLVAGELWRILKQNSSIPWLKSC